MDNIQDSKDYWDMDYIVEHETACWPDDYVAKHDPDVDVIHTWCKRYQVPWFRARILELGCGGGRALILWDECNRRYNWNFQLEAIDHSPKAIKIAQKYIKDVTFHEMGIEEMAFNDHFDVIYTRIALQHNSEWKQEKILPKIYSALKNDGLFYMVRENTICSVRGDKLESGYMHDERESFGTAAWWISRIAKHGFELLDYHFENYTWKKI